MMESFSLTLARAGYQVVAFDFEGHGRHAVPMSGDVNALDGTTRLLVAQTREVVAHASELSGQPVAVLGHSMASDILVRTGLEDPATGPIVAISMYSEAVTADAPKNLLIISGEYEPHLRDAARGAMSVLDAYASEGQTVTVGDVTRRAVAAPGVEHVGVLYSATALTEARDWLNASYEWSGTEPLHQTGPWVLGLLAALVALFWPLVVRFAGDVRAPETPISLKHFGAALVVPAVAAPLIATQIPLTILPVLVADYLMLHLLIYGALQLGLLWYFGKSIRGETVRPLAALAFVAWGLGVFGLALDHYGASFLPNFMRLGIIAVLALGTVPFLVSDAMITDPASSPAWRRVVARLVLIASLVLAVAIKPSELFFLVIILPVILLFFVVYGTMGRWIAARSGPLSAGLASGLILAWALGVSFPLFQS